MFYYFNSKVSRFVISIFLSISSTFSIINRLSSLILEFHYFTLILKNNFSYLMVPNSPLICYLSPEIPFQFALFLTGISQPFILISLHMKVFPWNLGIFVKFSFGPGPYFHSFLFQKLIAIISQNFISSLSNLNSFLSVM